MSVVDFRAYAPIPSAMQAVARPGPEMAPYVERYGLGDPSSLTMGPDAFADFLTDSGVEAAVLTAPATPNGELAQFCAAKPDRYFGIASIDVGQTRKTAVATQVQRAWDDGLRMVGIGPYKDGMRANDRAYYPLYAKCEELGMAVVVHTSFNFGRGLKLDYGRPIHLDDVATDFPSLRIVASHAGWPWIGEMVAVAWHHENVYIEMSAHDAKHMARPGSGWEMLFNYGNGPLKHRLLWGSIWPYLEPREQIAGVKNLPLSETTLNLMWRENPSRLLQEVGATSMDSLAAQKLHQPLAD